jgi:hypothetical protein
MPASESVDATMGEGMRGFECLGDVLGGETNTLERYTLVDDKRLHDLELHQLEKR